MLDAPARIAAVDYGTKRVGLALADPLRTFAQPHGAFSQQEAVAELQRLHDRNKLEIVVVGWPLTEDGAEGVATERVQQYVNRLRNALPEVDLVKWDERYSSLEAERKIDEAGGRKSHEKGRVDAVAAAVILQEYLDQH